MKSSRGYGQRLSSWMSSWSWKENLGLDEACGAHEASWCTDQRGSWAQILTESGGRLAWLCESRSLAMAGALVGLACCARPSALTSFSNPVTNFVHDSQSLLAGVGFRRSHFKGTAKRSESGHGVWALRAIFNSDTNSPASASDDDEGNDVPPPGCSRIKLELKKPLGIAFEEDKYGNMFVGEVIEGGNADKSGLVDAGDQLIATSAIVYGSEEDYQGVMVRKGMQKVRLNVRGEKFETVIAAIGTHPYYIKVALELQKCKPVVQASPNGSTIN